MSDKYNDDIIEEEIQNEDDDNKYESEKFCTLCRRSEKQAGKMIDLPNNIHICSDCMQKSFDSMNQQMSSSNFNYNDFFNMPNICMIDLSSLQNPTQHQKVKPKKKEKKAAYRSLIRPELADELYDRILNIIVVQKKYRDPDYSAKDLAKELKTNTRYLSAVVNSRFGMNYSCLLNEYRVKDALHLLTDKRYADKNVEEISAMVGFANRQSFYAAFYKNVGETPNGYRKKHAEKKK